MSSLVSVSRVLGGGPQAIDHILETWPLNKYLMVLDALAEQIEKENAGLNADDSNAPEMTGEEFVAAFPHLIKKVE